ncbi:RNA-binding S4 domain-containing protein [Nosocomiicoccus ampullae]|uniref:RQC P-site tRNA stabilizing factor n=1 Tax=Nosocomiicoccus ampullae TaxID=489910 RepID=A0A9Q2CZY6_9STAP|nr:RNA-binding S4 domain-containing protein [Nosocomiicoccus ampullae]MBB5176629.1 ribosomal 50S subunit-recycling heat shock protein [Nosocomiicoccus ampullae]QYA46790.1 RNA-binding S4 domain-containing protein [Nosocomiicoccus ampullae]
MRLDKFLKVSRIIKRRPLAKTMSDDGRIEVNGRVAKAGTNVEVGDELKIRFGKRIVTYKVLDLKEHAKKEEAEQMIELINDEKIEDDSEW